MNRTLRDLVLNHSNDYGFDVNAAILQSPAISDLSIVIPYYNSKFLKRVIHSLYVGLEKVEEQYTSWKFEVIVIDDGSKEKADKVIGEQYYKNLTIITFESNRGVTEARNTGLQQARFSTVLFMDNDIVVSDDIILKHLKVHSFAGIYKPCITLGFFATVQPTDPILSETLTKEVVQSRINDFRLSCIYQSSWIGCEEDMKFIGRRFEIVRETNDFKNWPIDKLFGPWILPNMVLGAFFMVRRESSLAVNGFDRSFVGYGFTETSLPTKLVALYGHYVVPVTDGTCLHIDDDSEWLSRYEKNRSFRQKHTQYFNHYLELTCKEAING